MQNTKIKIKRNKKHQSENKGTFASIWLSQRALENKKEFTYQTKDTRFGVEQEVSEEKGTEKPRGARQQNALAPGWLQEKT